MSGDSVGAKRRGSEGSPEHRAQKNPRTSLAGPWSFLKAPTAKDIRGSRRTAKALDAPPRPFDFLLVMDFEWTCDDRGPFPIEIIEFPAVLVDMRAAQWPGRVVDTFQQYVRPVLNPRLTAFCTRLTAITQADVDAGVLFPEALQRFLAWLRSHGLQAPASPAGLPPEHAPASRSLQPGHETPLPAMPHGPSCAPSAWTAGSNKSCDEAKQTSTSQSPTCAVVTWGDSDVMSALSADCSRHKVPRPQLFDKWINLKPFWMQHYKRPPTGGLQACVESLGMEFEGRAHSGLVDAHNTAKIVLHMSEGGFRFMRTTRGFGPDGRAWGQGNSSKSRLHRQ